MEWISVKDRLPEINTFNLVTYGAIPFVAVYKGLGVWIDHDLELWEPDEVTHWMPLPEPPKD
ncbi:MAG: DUF551 domain-containing protein [Saprospiraceae bacterium]